MNQIPQVVAITPYLNTRPYLHHGAPAGFSLLELSPRQAVAALQAGRICAGLVPVAALPSLEGVVAPLGECGIAAAGPVGSVALFSRLPFPNLDGRSRVAVSADSVTSNRLLWLLLRHRRGGVGLPQLQAPGSDGVEAELLIGDRALRRRQRDRDQWVTDLAELWQRRFQCPFVFARWVVRRELATAGRRRLEAWLEAYLQRERRLKLLAARQDHDRAGLTPAQALDYLDGLRSRLGEAERRGQALFLSLLPPLQPAGVSGAAVAARGGGEPCH